MKLRKLLLKDALYMLEWMHDDSIVHYMGTNFSDKTLKDCELFIENSWSDQQNLHMAIVDEDDQYMGTVSLKHINRVNNCAEFAITVGARAMGKGFSRYGMQEIIRTGFEEMGLKEIYWCVSAENLRAVKFYDKNGYQRLLETPKVASEFYTKEQSERFLWYVVTMEA